jgi:hypothetical protein
MKISADRIRIIFFQELNYLLAAAARLLFAAIQDTSDCYILFTFTNKVCALMKNTFVVTAVLLVIFFGALLGTIVREPEEFELPSRDGYIATKLGINLTTVHLAGGCYEVTFDVTEDQAYSIARGLEKATGPRPLTHDIFRDVIDTFGIEVLDVRIDRYENDIYYATIYMQQGSRILQLDARPSDSIAIAIRTGVPVYFREDLLESRGTYIC